MDINALLKAVSEYGITLVVAVLALAGMVALFRLYTKSWQERLDFVEARRLEERQSRLDAEGRLASNSEVLEKATDAFAAQQSLMTAQQRLMESFMERSNDRPARRG